MKISSFGLRFRGAFFALGFVASFATVLVRFRFNRWDNTHKQRPPLQLGFC